MPIYTILRDLATCQLACDTFANLMVRREPQQPFKLFHPSSATCLLLPSIHNLDTFLIEVSRASVELPIEIAHLSENSFLIVF